MLFKKITINLKRNFIRFSKGKKVANRYKRMQYEKLISPNLYKWGVSYSIFDGIELLEHSVKSIRNSCNYINVVYSILVWE